MTSPHGLPDLRAATGLPQVGVLRDPERVARVDQVTALLERSAVLSGLVRLAGRVTWADCAQLSLLGEQQVANAVRCNDSDCSEQVSALEDSLCTITLLSGDVLVAADARTHPWLHDLSPVVSGAVGAYLGAPLHLTDGTAVGALCVYGPEPRAWSERDVILVGDVADLVALELQRLVGE